jgi:predicted ATP-grasp superfamily ATP-dependent carboligase
MDSQPDPVLIVAADTIIGLTVMRSLGRRGVPVYAAVTLDDALGPHSTYCRGWFRMSNDPGQAIGQIREHLRKWKITHLIGISEAHISLLNSHREELARDYTLLFPPQDVFERAIRKSATLECARRAGVPAPETRYPQTVAAIDECRELQFPVILKMSFHQFPPGTVVQFRHKALRVENFEELHRVLSALPPGQYPMVQEFIPGYGIGMSMLVRSGKTVLAFQHRRVREFPPEGGIGVLCEAVSPDARLVEHSRRLLQEMGWEGVAMVEYRLDPDTGRFALMEVNGRFWGSLPTAIHAGADFPFWLYRTSFPGSELPAAGYRAGLRARSLAGDTKWLNSVLRKGTVPVWRALPAYLAAFGPSMRYFMFVWDDPKPALANLAGRFWKQKGS